jgi:CRP-like cAMP-binding protein
MNQKYNLKTGNVRYGNQPIFQNLNKTVNHWAYGKLKPVQTYLFKGNINNKILENLPDAVLQKLFVYMEQVYLDQNESIYQPDDAIRYLYFPQTSVFSEFQILEDGKTIEVAMTGSEGIVGFSTVFNPFRSPHWAQASIAGNALRIDAEVFRQEFAGCDLLQKGLFEFVNSYIGQISQRVICSTHHLVEERLCCWLLMLHDRCGTDKLQMTQEQIARFLGVHRPSVTLITQSLREKEVIDYKRGKIFILDRAKLENMACFCYETTKFSEKLF